MENVDNHVMEDGTGAKFVIPRDGEKGKIGKTEELTTTISLSTLIKKE